MAVAFNDSFTMISPLALRTTIQGWNVRNFVTSSRRAEDIHICALENCLIMALSVGV